MRLAAWRELLSLTRIQAIVGITTGLITIVGALYSATELFGPAAGTGSLVAIVQDMVSGSSVPDATIEVLTPTNTLVATLTPDRNGRASQSLKEGIYLVRASHPRYEASVTRIQVFSKQTVQVHARLRSGSSTPLEHAGRAVSGGLRAVRRAFGF